MLCNTVPSVANMTVSNSSDYLDIQDRSQGIGIQPSGSIESADEYPYPSMLNSHLSPPPKGPPMMIPGILGVPSSTSPLQAEATAAVGDIDNDQDLFCLKEIENRFDHFKDIYSFIVNCKQDDLARGHRGHKGHNL